jgi:hypothetical protein
MSSSQNIIKRTCCRRDDPLSSVKFYKDNILVLWYFVNIFPRHRTDIWLTEWRTVFDPMQILYHIHSIHRVCSICLRCTYWSTEKRTHQKVLRAHRRKGYMSSLTVTHKPVLRRVWLLIRDKVVTPAVKHEFSALFHDILWKRLGGFPFAIDHPYLGTL